MCRVVAVAAAVLLLAPLPVARAAPARVGVWLVSRVSSRPAVAALTVRFTSRRGLVGFGMAVEVVGSGADQDVPFTSISQIGQGDPVVYGVDTPACPPAACSVTASAGGFWQELTFKRVRPGTSAFVVAAVDFDTVVKPAKGWRVTPLPATSFRRVLAEEAEAVGAAARGTSVEVFQRAEARGGPYGSVVVMTLPCQFHGVGSATLTGGIRPQTQHCPREYAADRLSATNAAATTWRWEGLAAGLGGFSTRLAVIDPAEGPRLGLTP